MNQYNEEQLKDIAERRASFIQEYGKLREKYQCDMASMPAFIPNDRGTFDVAMNVDVVDLKYLSVKSPIVVADK